MAEERMGFQVWGDDPESDRYGTRSKAFLPTDWTDDLVNKDYIKNKHLNSISEALLRLNSRCDSFRFINYSELVNETVGEGIRYFKAFGVSTSTIIRNSRIHITVLKSLQDETYEEQTIVFNGYGQIVDLGSGRFSFGYRFKSGQLDFCLPISSEDTFIWNWSVRSTYEANIIHCVPGNSVFLNIDGPNQYTIQQNGDTGCSFNDYTNKKVLFNKIGFAYDSTTIGEYTLSVKKRIAGSNIYYDLYIEKEGTNNIIKILGDSFRLDAKDIFSSGLIAGINLSATNKTTTKNIIYKQEINDSFQTEYGSVSSGNQVQYEIEMGEGTAINCPVINLSNYEHQGFPSGVTEFTMNKSEMDAGTKVLVTNNGGLYDILIHSGGEDVVLGANCCVEFITNGTIWLPLKTK